MIINMQIPAGDVGKTDDDDEKPSTFSNLPHILAPSW